jgi:hypothetical protein
VQHEGNLTPVSALFDKNKPNKEKDKEERRGKSREIEERNKGKREPGLMMIE